MAANKLASSDKHRGIEFAIGALAGVGTALLTNPTDVLKTRLQLQGELARPGSYTKVYKGTFHAGRTIFRREGLWALQAGLTPAMGLQLIINTMRLGSYNFAKRHGLTVNENGDTIVYKTALLSGVTGSAAVVIGSPLYLAKVKLQANSMNKNSFNGQQPLNTRIILKSLWREGGFKNLYRDWNANIPRLFIGSAVQLSAFGITTDWLNTFDEFSKRPVVSTFIASAISGTCLVISVHPLDVMSTRLYNQGTNSQGKGTLYNGMFDTISKIFRTESIFGLYKGIFPNWLRLAPYVVVSQLLYETITQLYFNFHEERL